MTTTRCVKASVFFMGRLRFCNKCASRHEAPTGKKCHHVGGPGSAEEDHEATNSEDRESEHSSGSERRHVLSPVACSRTVGHMGTLREDVDGLLGKMSNIEALLYKVVKVTGHQPRPWGQYYHPRGRERRRGGRREIRAPHPESGSGVGATRAEREGW